MRFFHIADVHLGAEPDKGFPWSQDRSREIWDSFRRVIEQAGRDQADLFLIAGDLFHRQPLARELKEVNAMFSTIPDTRILLIAGNHDYPVHPLPQICRGIEDYPALQQALLDRAANLGIPCQADSSGAYSAVLGDTEILGLNAVTHWRRFRFPESAQLDWLANRLNHSSARNRIILCHAPLANHRPYHHPGDPPYLHLDKKLQGILDSQRDILFLSGHTHVSPNCQSGCIERDSIGNLYINTGSIRPTTLKPEEPLQPASWTEGNAIELEIGKTHICVKGISIKTGQYISRGYYRFPK